MASSARFMRACKSIWCATAQLGDFTAAGKRCCVQVFTRSTIGVAPTPPPVGEVVSWRARVCRARMSRFALLVAHPGGGTDARGEHRRVERRRDRDDDTGGGGGDHGLRV